MATNHTQDDKMGHKLHKTPLYPTLFGLKFMLPTGASTFEKQITLTKVEQHTLLYHNPYAPLLELRIELDLLEDGIKNITHIPKYIDKTKFLSQTKAIELTRNLKDP